MKKNTGKTGRRRCILDGWVSPADAAGAKGRAEAEGQPKPAYKTKKISRSAKHVIWNNRREQKSIRRLA
jgi:hypothetical protein